MPQVRLCATCKTQVRPGRRGEWFHTAPGLPSYLKSLARETKMYDEQQAKSPGVRNYRAPEVSMEVEIEGY